MIRLKNLSLNQGGRCLLDQINLEIAPGEALVIWGLNGAGKTSLLDVLSGWKEPDEGGVYINNESLVSLESLLRAKNLAYLTQDQSISFDGGVWDLLDSFVQNQESLKKLAEDFGVLNLLDRRFKALSGGEQAKIALLRAMIQFEGEYRGRYLLLDEPLAHLDISYQQVLYENLIKLKQKGLGLIMVIHDLNQAWRYADRFCILFKGKLYECQEVQDVLNFFEENYDYFKLNWVYGEVQGQGLFINI